MLLSPCEDDFDLVIEILKTKGYNHLRIYDFLNRFFNTHDPTVKIYSPFPYAFDRVNIHSYHYLMMNKHQMWPIDPTKIIDYKYNGI